MFKMITMNATRVTVGMTWYDPNMTRSISK